MSVFDDQFFDFVDLACRETLTAYEANGIEPELGLAVVAFHVHMWRFISISIAGVKEPSVRAASEYCELDFMLRSPTDRVNVT